MFPCRKTFSFRTLRNALLLRRDTRDSSSRVSRAAAHLVGKKNAGAVLVLLLVLVEVVAISAQTRSKQATTTTLLRSTLVTVESFYEKKQFEFHLNDE